MEYQQFAIYCRWDVYERRHAVYGTLNGDDEAIRRGMMESARNERRAARECWRRAVARVTAALRGTLRVARPVA